MGIVKHDSWRERAKEAGIGMFVLAAAVLMFVIGVNLVALGGLSALQAAHVLQTGVSWGALGAGAALVYGGLFSFTAPFVGEMSLEFIQNAVRGYYEY